jgi:hypothetical protein
VRSRRIDNFRRSLSRIKRSWTLHYRGRRLIMWCTLEIVTRRRALMGSMRSFSRNPGIWDGRLKIYSSLKAINHTLLVLIPKSSNPTRYISGRFPTSFSVYDVV